MARKSRLARLLEETLYILGSVGIPTDDLSCRRKEKMAKAFLSVAGMKPNSLWIEARSDHRLRTRDVIRWMNEHLEENISSGSYDDIRRKDLLLPVEAGIVLKSAGNDTAATNDGTRTYAISPETVSLIRTFGTAEWETKLASFLEGRELLSDQLKKARAQLMMPVRVGDVQLYFGPGQHNVLQKAIIEDFLPRFGHGRQTALYRRR